MPRSWAGVASATIVASRPCSTGREHEIGGAQHGQLHRQKRAVAQANVELADGYADSE